MKYKDYNIFCFCLIFIILVITCFCLWFSWKTSLGEYNSLYVVESGMVGGSDPTWTVYKYCTNLSGCTISSDPTDFLSCQVDTGEQFVNKC